jgi:hypothetical protein
LALIQAELDQAIIDAGDEQGSRAFFLTQLMQFVFNELREVQNLRLDHVHYLRNALSLE